MSIDPYNNWAQLDNNKVGAYNSDLIDFQKVSDTEFLGLTTKGLIMFDCRCEGITKLIKYKDSSS